jgi:hypothetical protein
LIPAVCKIPFESIYVPFVERVKVQSAGMLDVKLALYVGG